MNDSPYRDEEGASAPRSMADTLLARVPKTPEKMPKGIHSEAHELAGKIVHDLEDTRPRAFGIWLGTIKRHGTYAVSIAFASVKDSKAKSPAKLLMWKLSQKKNGMGKTG